MEKKIEEKEFKAFDHKTGKIDLSHIDGNVIIVKPTEIHHKEDGDINNEPSFAIVMEHNYASQKFVGEISLKMLNDGLSDIGYEIVKKTKI